MEKYFKESVTEMILEIIASFRDIHNIVVPPHIKQGCISNSLLQKWWCLGYKMQRGHCLALLWITHPEGRQQHVMRTHKQPPRKSLERNSGLSTAAPCR